LSFSRWQECQRGLNPLPYWRSFPGQHILRALGGRYLKRFNTRARPFEDFKAALDMEDPRWRYYAVRKALVRIQMALSGK
jgi:hypothetical protein